MAITAQNLNQKPGYKQTEVGEIPTDWEVKKLGDCLLGAPQYGINAPAVQYTDSLPIYIRITDITDDSCFSPENIASVRYVSGDRYVLKAGDLVFARTGASVGKTYLYKPEDGNLVFAGYLIRVKVNPSKLLPGYLAAYVKTGHYWSWVKAMSMRSGQPGINGTEYAQLPIPLPSPPEQRTIATALSDVDALITSLDRLITKKRDIKQATMQQLLTGKMRLPGFNIELKQDYKRTEVGMIPVDWEVKKLGDVADFLDGRRRPINERDRAKMRGEYPYYGASGIVDYVNDYIFDEELILLGEDGENILSRNSKLAFRVSGKIWVNNHAHVLRPKANTDASFLTEYLESLDYEQYNTGTTQPKLNKRVCLEIIVFLPLLTEQQAIATVLSDMDAEIAALEQKRDKTRALKQGMMQELLTGKTRLV